MSEEDGGQAFPDHYTNGNGYLQQHPGMTLRDWFAGQALAGIMAGDPDAITIQNCFNASLCYQLADAMLAERARVEERGHPS